MILAVAAFMAANPAGAGNGGSNGTDRPVPKAQDISSHRPREGSGINETGPQEDLLENEAHRSKEPITTAPTDGEQE